MRAIIGVSDRRWWRLSDSPIRFKAALILLPPALAAVISAVFGLWSAGVAAQAAGQSRVLFDVGSAAAGVAQRLQAERAAAAAVLLPGVGPAGRPEVYERRIAETDDVIAVFRERRRGLENVPAGVAAVLARVDTDLRDLDALRSRVRDGGQVALSAAIFGYRITVADVIAYRVAVAQSGVDAVLADEMRAGAALSRAREAVGLQQVAVLQALSLGRLTPALNQEIVSARATHDQAMREFGSLARPGWRALAGRTLTGADVVAAARLEGAVAGTALYAPVRLPGGAAGWSRVMTARADLLRAVETAVDADVSASVEAVRDRRLRDAAVQGGAVLLVLVVALLFTAGVARSLVGRLYLLEAGALRVARIGLPELVDRLGTATSPVQAEELAERSAAVVAVPVPGTDEVGRVAEAFNAVHSAAVRAAVAEARVRTQVVLMITSVARRVNAMTARVLNGLEALERDEADPGRLAQIFGVDHDATRLRRYAASLLVVAGGAPGQSQSEPTPVEVLINGAVSEVEGYRRVCLGVLVEVLVDPQAIDGLVHILAELLDNATSFSTSDVTVTAGWHYRDLLIQVADTGIGITADDLERLNSRLADPGLDVDVADRMGLIVVSRLAAHLGVRVWLEPNRGGGVVASVLVPAGLITRVQRVYVRDLPTPQAGRNLSTAPSGRNVPTALPGPAALPAGPVLPVTGTGWQPAPAPISAGTVSASRPVIDATQELPRLTTGPHVQTPIVETPAAVSTATVAAQPDPVIFQQVRQASPWLGPTRLATGDAVAAVFDTAADAGWRAAQGVATPVVAGTTARGLPIRRPGAHALPDSPAPTDTVPVVVDPAAVHAQVTAVMRGLRAAAPPRPQQPTGASTWPIRTPR